MIQILVFSPLIALIINNCDFLGRNKIRKILNMIISILTLYLVLWIFLTINFNNNEFQYRNSFGVLPFFKITLGIDGINISLILLMCILEPILFLLSKGEIRFSQSQEKKILINKLLIIKFLIIILFLTLDLFIFFITFELILIPMYLIITKYGSQYKYFLPRLEAAFRFFFFTMIGSFFMLISIIIFYIKFGTTNNELLNIKINNDSSLFLFKILWIFLFFSFFIKIPIFPFHTWLPLAHSDAPTIGSVILAALLLKLASYGIIRYSIYIFNPFIIGQRPIYDLYSFFLPFIYILAYLSILFCSFIAIRALFDIKKIIAYSSIVHMNFSIFGFFSKDFLGLFGSSLLMFTHAFISSSLFILIGFLYKRFHSRYLPYFKGISQIMPLFSFFFLFFSFANISLPFCSSFLSEFFILLSSFHFNPILSFFLLFALLFSSSFVLWFGNRLLFGSLSPYLLSLGKNFNFKIDPKDFSPKSCDLTAIEFFSLFPFFFFTLFFTFFPQPFILLFTLPLLNFI